ncbi:MAG: hypothetical protein KJ062_19930, partial [Thermoanaerobaculia bacterium]|nr:hypothetical protein [Thermoanaerobaculia bacterium]
LRGDSAIGTIVAHIRQEPADVRKLRPQAPAWLAAVVTRLLAKDRDRRYATAADVLVDLESRRARRAPRRLGRPQLLAGSAVLVLLLAALAFLPALPWNRPRLFRLVADGAGGVQALDNEGRLLWTREGAEPGREIALVSLGEGRVGAVVARGGLDEPRKALEILDGATGRVVSEMALPDPSTPFSGFANTFAARALLAFDVEGDGVDEVAVSLAQIPLFPSVTWVCDLANRRVVSAFHASGHHYARAAADVDGDGRKEVILAGFNNRMGYLGAVAAVRVPREGEVATRDGVLPYAESPDRAAWGHEASLLAWYALLPSTVFDGSRSPAVEAAGGVLRAGPFGPRQVELALDGFPRGRREAGEAGRRALARVEAYVHLRETARLRGAGLPAEALGEADLSLGRARAAGDAMLAHWIARVRAKTLLDGGRRAEADAAWTASFERAEEPAPIAVEAGRAFHLKGDLVRAVAWYRRGLEGRGSRARLGGDPRDLIVGQVLALVEAGRLDDAAAEVDRFDAAFPDRGFDSAPLRSWVAWRAGKRPEAIEDDEMQIGLFRYWRLEVRRVLGEDPATLLDEAERLRRQSLEAAPLLDSLVSELLSALGRREEGAALAAEALEATRRLAATEVEARAHLSLVEARARRLGVRPS